jgi:hypothetical protein
MYSRQVLKSFGDWELVKVGETRHFKNGRPNLHVQIRYHIEKVYTSIEQQEINESRRVASGYFNMISKTEANKVWRELTKQGTLNGIPVKIELKEGA